MTATSLAAQGGHGTLVSHGGVLVDMLPRVVTRVAMGEIAKRILSSREIKALL